MNTLIYSSSLLTAFLGGVLALFAPCCIVSLLPTYVAATLRVGRWRLLSAWQAREGESARQCIWQNQGEPV